MNTKLFLIAILAVTADIISNHDIIVVSIILMCGFLGFVARNASEGKTITKKQYIKNLIATMAGILAIGLFSAGNLPNKVSFGLGIVCGWIGGNLMNILSKKVLRKIDEN